MTATVQASYSTVQGDGTGDGKAFTTGTVVSGDWLLVAVGSSSNGESITVPATGTWVEVTLPDNSIAAGGGQLRVYKCINPASTTAYTWTLTGGRRSIVGALLRDADPTNCVDVASSLETAVGTNHAPPSVTPVAAGELCVDFAMMRCFSPDVSNWSTPATGLTWTEHKDVQGADGNNNVRLALGTATAGSSGVAVSTAVWTNTDANEESMVARVLTKSAASGVTGAAATPNRSATGSTGLKQSAGSATAAQRSTLADAGSKQGRAAAVAVQRSSATATTRKQATGTAAALARPAAAAEAAKKGIGAAAATTRSATGAAAAQSATGAARVQSRATTAAAGNRTAAGVGAAVARAATTVARVVPADGLAGQAHGPLTQAFGVVDYHTVSLGGSIG